MVLLWLAAAALAQPSAGAKAAPQPERKFMMWKVSSPAGTSPAGTAYLLGSIHLASSSIYPLPPAIEDAFAASKTLVVEVNLNDLDRQRLTTEMMQAGMYAEGDGLSRHVPKGVLSALDDFCVRHGQLPRGAFERFRPWLAALMVSIVPYMEKGEDPNSGIDMHFMNEAGPGQRIQELETADFQLKLLSSFNDEEQVKSLDAALHTSDEDAEKLERAYFAADQPTLIRMIEEGNGLKSATRKLIYDRNPRMADGVENCMKTAAPCFVVVGAAHLIGEEGVVRILQQRHYQVESVDAVAAAR